MIYPNPNNGQFIVDISHIGESENITLQLSNSQGKIVEQRAGKLKNGSNQFLFNNTSIAKGSYNLRVMSATNFKIVKVIIL